MFYGEMATAAQLATNFGSKVAERPNNSGKTYKTWGKRRAINQLLAMQEQLFQQTLDPEVKGHIKAACARAYEDLEERLRILGGRPLPGSLRPEQDKPKQPPKTEASWEEPKQVQDAVVVQPSGVTLPKDGAVAPIAGETKTPQAYKS